MKKEKTLVFIGAVLVLVSIALGAGLLIPALKPIYIWPYNLPLAGLGGFIIGKNKFW